MLNPGRHPRRQPSGRLLPLSFAGALLAVPLAVVALPFEYRREATASAQRRSSNGPRDAGDARCDEAGLLAAVLDSIADGVIVVGQDGSFLVANLAAQLILAIDADSANPATGQERYGVFRPDGTRLSPAEMPSVRALAGAPDGEVELLVRNAAHPAGVWISTTARALDPRSGHSGAVVVFRDITDRKRDQKRLATQLETMLDAMIGVDTDGNITFVNAKTEQLFGYPRAELLGRNMDILIPEAVCGEHARHRAAYLSNHTAAGPIGPALEISGLHRDGSKVPLEVTLSTLEAEGGVIVTMAIRDISDRKAAQQAIEGLNGELHRNNDELELRVAKRTAELAAQAQQLKASNAELEAFSYSVSHDLRAPLRAVDGFGKVLATRYADVLDESGQRYLDKIRAGARQMGHLIDGLLAFSRLQREALTREPFDVTGLVLDVWDELAPARAGREVELTIAPLPIADADPRLVRHVLANLLSNAVKYTRTAAPARIQVGSQPDGPDRLSYYVRDNGVGFDMRYSDKLFTVFQRMHRAEDYEGSGIGLALAARIVHRHGGRIWADARPDEGATFSFTLSGHDEPETAPTAEDAADGQDHAGQPGAPGQQGGLAHPGRAGLIVGSG